ncbi:MAG: divalent-cation tolerance protein CutA [Terriglobales bacterium]
MIDAILVSTTCASAEEAERIAAAVIEQRLAACATIGAPVRSRYRWQDQVETATEVPLTLKSKRDCFLPLAAAIQRLHSYKVPEILAVPVLDASPEYLAWITANTTCSPLD